MKKALILGTNAGQADIIRYLRDNQWYVHSCGHQKKGPGVHVSDAFHLVDIIDTNKVKNLAESIDPDIIYSVSSDVAMRTATKVSEELQLPHFLNTELINLFHYKNKLRSRLNNIGLSEVEYLVLHSTKEITEWKTFPCIVKPVDSQGQRGLSLISKRDDLHSAVEKALKFSKSSSVIIEEYLEGVEVSTNVIVQNGKVLVNEFTERLVHPHPLIGLPYGHAIPVRSVNTFKINDAANIVENLVRELKIEDAVLYIQFKVTSKGPKIIEVAPRLDGCHIWRLIKFARGYDLREYAINCLIGSTIDHNVDEQNRDPYTLLFYQLDTGIRFSKDKLNIFKNPIYQEYRYREGEIVEAVNGNFEVVGYYVKADKI